MNLKSFLTGIYVLLLISYCTQAMQPTQVMLRTMLMRAAVQRSLYRLHTSSTEPQNNRLITINKNHPVVLKINNVLDKFKLPESVSPLALSMYGLTFVSGIAAAKGFDIHSFLLAVMGGTVCTVGVIGCIASTGNDYYLKAMQFALKRELELETRLLSPEKAEEISKLIAYYPTVAFSEDALLKLLGQEDIPDTMRDKIIDLYRKYKAEYNVFGLNRAKRFRYERAKKNLKLCCPELDDQQINSMASALIGKEKNGQYLKLTD